MTHYLHLPAYSISTENFPGNNQEFVDLQGSFNALLRALQKAAEIRKISPDSVVLFDIDHTLFCEDDDMPVLRSGIELVNNMLGDPLPGLLSSSPQTRISRFQREMQDLGFKFDPDLCFSSSEYFNHSGAYSDNQPPACPGIPEQILSNSGIYEKILVMNDLKKKLGIDTIILIDDSAEEFSYEGLVFLNGSDLFLESFILNQYLSWNRIVTLTL